ncbi:hypothetical protein GCM10023084_07350 [Streptomyces lacrimifluminis]|uniref:Lipoprotein n=1 Tax=Streptomyces lacrimifluminis TaxID=1500077 RepID=A0A917NSX7_9ACTN|nr:hypothetical protein [Streptomyces lacrimifluminis]GGJ25453.1 hypothetical protein GCM10012282_22520 [Streptomyces lacrimifluminis]
MRGSVCRGWAVLGVVAVLAGGSAGCTSEADSGPRAEACVDGRYSWSGVRHREKLTALADPITFEKKTDSYSALLKPVADTVHRPKVTGAPAGVGAARVIKALGEHLKVHEPLADPSETERAEDSHYFEADTGDLKGSYYAWGWINFVDADFTYTCVGSTTSRKGHVRTWDTVGSGFLHCSSDAETAAGRAAARQTCPAGSAAAKAA